MRSRIYWCHCVYYFLHSQIDRINFSVKTSDDQEKYRSWKSPDVERFVLLSAIVYFVAISRTFVSIKLDRFSKTSAMNRNLAACFAFVVVVVEKFEVRTLTPLMIYRKYRWKWSTCVCSYVSYLLGNSIFPVSLWYVWLMAKQCLSISILPRLSQQSFSRSINVLLSFGYTQNKSTQDTVHKYFHPFKSIFLRLLPKFNQNVCDG